MLCQVCKDIAFDQLIPIDRDLAAGVVSGTQHHVKFADLVAAARSGCELCAAIEKNSIGQAIGGESLMKYPVKLKMRLKGREHSGYQGSSDLFVLCLGQVIAKLELFVPRDSDLGNPDLKIISGRPVNSNPTSSETFALAKTWIHECLNSEEHHHCGKADLMPRIAPSDTTSTAKPVQTNLPTRLIDIGLSGGFQESELILTAASQLPADLKYVALSHCWGQTQLHRVLDHAVTFNLATLNEDQKTLANIQDRKPLTTTSKTIEQRMKIIPMASLPKTFQDAIVFTRGLGLQYIWIDSLCIVQDSKSDWAAEASRMADVYKNSYVTIAAEASKDSHMGMLNPRTFDFESIELPFNSKARDIYSTIYVRPALDDWESCVNGSKSALSSRGWVLQESLLAPRTIRMAEGNVTPLAPTKRMNREWDWSHSKRFVGAGDSNQDEVEISYLQWSSIIQNYSTRNLSFPSDIYPALEGLARDFNVRLKDKYIAGLWRRDLLRGLLWRIEDSKSGDIAREADPPRAPTWSWASSTGGIIRDASDLVHRVGGYQVEIVEVVISPTDGESWSLDDEHNYYGQVKSGILTLRGRWTSCARWPRFEENSYDPRYSLVRNTEEGFGNMFRHFDSALVEQHEERSNSGRTLSLLEITAWAQTPESMPVVYYLILESGDYGEESAFKRVGVAALQKEATDLQEHENWVQDWEIKTVIIV